MSNKTISKQIIITSLTNLHVGSGDASFGVIDNLVQKDSITGIPIINGSSLKGAIREYLEESEDNSYNWKDIFGSSPNENNSDRRSGNINFFSADLVFLPVRSDKNPYYLATSPFVIKDFLNKLKFFNISCTDNLVKALEKFAKIDLSNPLCEEEGAILEDMEADKLGIDKNSIEEIKNYFFVNKSIKLAVISDADFKYLCENLTVIARNHLENGESQNLWYEQVVPRNSIFYTFNTYRENNEELFKKFSNELQESNIHIGANATIGYGLCKFEIK